MEAGAVPRVVPTGLAPFSSPRLLRVASDARLVGLIREGRSAAFEAVYDRHHRGILSFCRHMLGDADEAEDAVQHTFMAAYNDLISSEKPIHLRAWLFTIARNRCYSILRARREQPAGELDEPETEGLAAQVQRRQDLRDLVNDMQRLPEEQRAALVLAEIDALSHAEISDVLGVPRDKVKALVFQARESLLASRAARDTACAEIRQQIAAGRGASLRRANLRRHLRECDGCREFRAQLDRQRRQLAVLLPVAPTIALKEAVLGGTVGAAAGGGIGGGLVASSALKSGIAKGVVGALLAGVGTAGTLVVAVTKPNLGPLLRIVESHQGAARARHHRTPAARGAPVTSTSTGRTASVSYTESGVLPRTTGGSSRGAQQARTRSAHARMLARHSHTRSSAPVRIIQPVTPTPSTEPVRTGTPAVPTTVAQPTGYGYGSGVATGGTTVNRGGGGSGGSGSSPSSGSSPRGTGPAPSGTGAAGAGADPGGARGSTGSSGTSGTSGTSGSTGTSTSGSGGGTRGGGSTGSTGSGGSAGTGGPTGTPTGGGTTTTGSGSGNGGGDGTNGGADGSGSGSGGSGGNPASGGGRVVTTDPTAPTTSTPSSGGSSTSGGTAESGAPASTGGGSTTSHPTTTTGSSHPTVTAQPSPTATPTSSSGSSAPTTSTTSPTGSSTPTTSSTGPTTAPSPTSAHPTHGSGSGTSHPTHG